MNTFWHRHRNFFIYLAITSLICLIIASGFAIWRARQPKPVTTNTTTTQVAQPEPTPELNPLQIEAIKARNYPGSKIVVEQDLGSKSGYNSKIVSYKSDEFKVFALMATPVGSAPVGGWPVVILNHGYVEPSAYRTTNNYYSAPISALASSGFAVLMPDFRGHGSSQGTPEGGHFSPVYTYDNLNLVNSIPQTPELGLSSSRIGTLGHSLGAHTSLRVAVVNPNIKATVYAAGVVASVDDILYNWPNSPMPSDLPASIHATRDALLAKYGTPKTNPEFWNSVSAINYVGDITGNSQIHHSQNDSVVPLNFSTKLDSALKTADKPVEFYVYPGSDHQIISNSQLAISRMVEFFRKTL
jgi:dipeptidyl aminopeptidase/acylaminoacyl peptidase